jgi:hypothetical protein
MTKVDGVHKSTQSRWAKLWADLLAAQALARPERGMLLWGDKRTAEPHMPRPDDTFEMIRIAFRPRIL